MTNLFFIFVITFSIGIAFPKETIKLFDNNGAYKKDYDQIIKDLKIFDILEMPDGKKFKILEKKTGGKTTEVLKVVPIGHRYDVPGDEYILRIPREVKWDKLYKYYIKGIDELGELTKKQRINPNLPKFYHSDKHYVIAENIDHHFTAEKFLEYPRFIDPPEIWDEAAEKFKQFALQNQNMISLGDFKAQQMIYDLNNKQWRLIDWKEGPSFYEGKDIGEHLFTFEKLSYGKSKFNLSDKGRLLLDEIDETIKEKRLLDVINPKLGKNYSKLKEALSSKEDYVKIIELINDSKNPSYKVAIHQYFLKNSEDLFKVYQNVDELNEFGKMIGSGPVEKKFKILLTNKYLSQVKDAKTFTSVLKKLVGVNNDQLSDYMDSIWKEQEEHFFSLNPSKSEMEDVLRMMNNPQYKRRYLDLALSRQLIDQKAYDELGEMMNVPEKVANKVDKAPSLRNRDEVLSTIEEINRDLQEEDKQGKSLIGKIKNCLQGIFQGKVIQK